MGAIEDSAQAQSEYVDAMVPHYVIAGLWSTPGDAGEDGQPDPENLDDVYGAEDVAPEALAAIREDCEAFVVAAWHLVREWESSPIHSGTGGHLFAPEQVGHDFLLTRDHHGTGFWDRGTGAVGDELTRLAHPFGDSGFYAGDDGRVYVE